MILRAILAFVLAFAISGCGVKNDLLMPNGNATAKNQKDPSKPPRPLAE